MRTLELGHGNGQQHLSKTACTSKYKNMKIYKNQLLKILINIQEVVQIQQKQQEERVTIAIRSFNISVRIYPLVD